MQRGARSRAAAAAAAGQQEAGGAAGGREAAGAAGIPHITFRPFQPQAASLAGMPPVLPIPAVLPSTASSLGAGGRLAGFGGGHTRSSAGSLFGGGRGAGAELALASPFASAVPYGHPAGQQRQQGGERGEVRLHAWRGSQLAISAQRPSFACFQPPDGPSAKDTSGAVLPLQRKLSLPPTSPTQAAGPPCTLPRQQPSWQRALQPNRALRPG